VTSHLEDAIAGSCRKSGLVSITALPWFWHAGVFETIHRCVVPLRKERAVARASSRQGAGDALSPANPAPGSKLFHLPSALRQMFQSVRSASPGRYLATWSSCALASGFPGRFCKARTFRLDPNQDASSLQYRCLETIGFLKSARVLRRRSN